MPERMWRRGPDGEILRRSPPQAEPPAAPRADEPEAPPGPAGHRASLPRARLGLALRLGARDTYDYLGTGLLLSAATVLLDGMALIGGRAAGSALFSRLPGLLPQLLILLSAAGGLVLVGGPVQAGLFRYARNAAARLEPEIADFLWGFRHAFGRSVRLAALQAGTALALLGNAWFYSAIHGAGWIVLSLVFLYLFLFWSVVTLYQWPLLAETKDPVRVIVRKSALLVLDNFPYTLLLAAATVVGQGLLWATGVGGVLLGPHALAQFLTQATRELFRRYGVLGPDPTLDPISEETTG